MCYQNRSATVVIAAFLIIACFADTAVGQERAFAHHTVEIDGIERSWAVYAPHGLDAARSLVLVLHGSGGSIDRIRQFTGYGFERLAERHRLVVVYPSGFEGNWNGCRSRTPFSANLRDVDDVAFVRTIVNGLRAAGAAEELRVVAFGFSGGAHMVLRLALEAPDLVSAIVAVGASLPVRDELDCAVSEASAPAALLINGTDDPINPYEGGEVVLPSSLGGSDLGRVISAEETAEWLARRAGHASGPVVVQDRDAAGIASTWAVRRTWTAPDLPPVSLVTVIGGGHTIPRPGVVFPEVVGKHSEDIDAVSETWRFLRDDLELK